MTLVRAPLSHLGCKLTDLAVVLSQRLADKVKMAEIRSDIYGASDHCPVTMEIEPPA